MYKLIFRIIGVGLISYAGFAQEVQIQNQMPASVSDMVGKFHDMEYYAQQAKLDKSYNQEEISLDKLLKAEGSPYWNKDFKKGFITDIKKNRSAEANLRYRIFDDIFEIIRSKNDAEDEFSYVIRNQKYSINIGENKFVFLTNLPAKGEGKPFLSGYAMLLEKGKTDKNVSLYKRFRQSYTGDSKWGNASYTSSLSDNSRIRNKNYYILKVDKSLHFITTSRKKVIEAFPDHKKELKKFISENKLKFKKNSKADELSRLVKYYNSLN